MTKKKTISREGADGGNATSSRTAPTVESQSPRYYYETQERAFAPGIADGWPTVIKAPHSPHGRLIRRDARLLDAAPDLLAALKAAAQFLGPDIARGPGVNGWYNTVALVEAAIDRAEGRG